MELTPRSTVGRDADVPRNRRESDTAGNIARARAPGGRRAGPRYRHDQRKARNNRTPGKSNAAAIRALSFGPAYVGSRPKRLRCQLNQQGLGCSKDLLDYSATKGAIHALTESLAQNLVEKGDRARLRVLRVQRRLELRHWRGACPPRRRDDGGMRTRSMSQRHDRFPECIEHQVSPSVKL